MANIDQQTYSVLRQGGAPQHRACLEMHVSSGRGSALEANFRAPRPGGGRAGPRFARHRAHVSAVMARGGFPALALTARPR